jgi:hypothetical protein
MTNNDDFKAFCDKRFVNGQEVIVGEFGNSTETFRGIVRGIYSYEPFEHYIIEWIDHPKALKDWDCTVVPKGCIR